MVDLEHVESGDEISAAIGERVETRAEDHVLVDTAGRYGALHEILRVARTHAHPPREREQALGGKAGDEKFANRTSFVTRQRVGEIIVQRPGWRLVAVQRSSDCSDKCSPAGTTRLVHRVANLGPVNTQVVSVKVIALADSDGARTV